MPEPWLSSAALREPGPLVTLVLSRTVEKGRLDRVGGPQVGPVLGGEVVEREQHVELVDDLLGGLGEPGGASADALATLSASVRELAL